MFSLFDDNKEDIHIKQKKFFKHFYRKRIENSISAGIKNRKIEEDSNVNLECINDMTGLPADCIALILLKLDDYQLNQLEKVDCCRYVIQDDYFLKIRVKHKFLIANRLYSYWRGSVTRYGDYTGCVVYVMPKRTQKPSAEAFSWVKNLGQALIVSVEDEIKQSINVGAAGA